MQAPISITLVTGFLGTGKTTLIGRLLKDPRWAGTVLVVNELAPVGLDQILLQDSAGDVIQLVNGCVCCSINQDLALTLRDLVRRHRSGELPQLWHVMIETTGAADPLPIMRTLASDGALASLYSLDRVVTTVDVHYGLEQLSRHPEAQRQVAVADFVALTKTTETTADRKGAVFRAVAAANPLARIIVDPECSADEILACTRFTQAVQQVRDFQSGELGHALRVTCLEADNPIEWERLVDWVEGLGSELGPDLLRIKGTVNVVGSDGRVFINGVQDTFYPPILLPESSASGRCSQIVVITQGVEPEEISESFRSIILA